MLIHNLRRIQIFSVTLALALSLGCVLSMISLPAFAIDEFTETQSVIEKSLKQYDRSKAYDLILSQKIDQEVDPDTIMLNLSRRIWISKRFERINDTVTAAIELLEISRKMGSGKYQLEAMDALAYVDYYNFNNDLALKKWNTVASLAMHEKMPNELYRYYRGLALLSIDEKNFEDAIAYYEKSISIVKSSNITGPDNSNVAAMLYAGLADLHFMCHDYSSAITADEKALDSISEEDVENRFEAYLHLADDHHLAGNQQKAKQYIEKAINLKPKVSDLLMNTKFPSKMGSIEAAIAYVNGDYEDSAKIFYDEYMHAKQEIDQVDIYIDTQNTASSYETSAIEKELNLLSELQKEQADKLATQRNLILFALLSIALLLALLATNVKNLKQQNTQKEELFRLSTIDQLTQIKNRRQIIKDMESIIPGDKCIALVDIDLFKQVNDTFGHVTGDMVLKRIAETIKTSIRKNDDVGRYGGEEFLILIDTSDLEVAKSIVERMRSNIEQLQWDIEGLEPTVSIGLIHSQQKIVDQLIEEADLRLYESKNSGRNKVTAVQI